jgi:hypothetical protein
METEVQKVSPTVGWLLTGLSKWDHISLKRRNDSYCKKESRDHLVFQQQIGAISEKNKQRLGKRNGGVIFTSCQSCLLGQGSSFEEILQRSQYIS